MKDNDKDTFLDTCIDFAEQDTLHINENQVQSFVFNSMMDNMHANLYVTDIETDEILFMSKKMKETFHLRQPEGLTCWKILQKNMKQRCSFCPVSKLLKKNRKNAMFVWEEKNTVNNKIYKNFDSLIKWFDGRLVHMQHSIDITEFKRLSITANIDDLTNLFNRRGGLAQLNQILKKIQTHYVPVTIALYDINSLKQINDLYGHKEGDNAIIYSAETARSVLGPDDVAFRLGGDEFVLIFYNTNLSQAEKRMNHMLEKMQDLRKDKDLSFDLSFCYGMTEIGPEDHSSWSEILKKIDEEMYTQKKKYHIKLAEEKLHNQNSNFKEMGAFEYDQDNFYKALIQSTDDYIFIGNLKTGTFCYPPSMVKEFNLPGTVLPNAAAVWGQLINPHDKKIFLESNQEIADGRVESHRVEYRAKNKDGKWIWLRCRGHMIRDKEGEPDLFAGIITNLGIRNKTDHVTGLFNKFELEGEVKHLIADFSKEGFSIMVLDLDDFKHINDLYDRLFGDEIIRLIARNITNILPEQTTMYRLDGDEFGLLSKETNEEALCNTYLKIQEILEKQQVYNGNKYYCTASAGCAIYPIDADNYLDLMKFANYSLQASKSKGKNCITLFSHNILLEKEQHLELTEILRESIVDGFTGFSLHYQPQAIAETGIVVGAEALARWECKKYGRIPPDKFIPLLEESNLISPVGRWIFNEAVKQCSIWRKQNPDFIMSINLSYLQVLEPDLLQFIDETLKKWNVPPTSIMVELTETYLVKESNTVSKFFFEIQRKGLSIAMDDFGTGYSSLGVLKKTPVDLVKIDKAFVADIQENAFDVTFIRFIVALCHDVGKVVCLEGVETEAEYEIVKQTGLEFIQGYYFGRPVPAQEFENSYLNS